MLGTPTGVMDGISWLMRIRNDQTAAMEPPPDVIFFMADGTGGNSPPPILASNKKAGDPVINTFAMHRITSYNVCYTKLLRARISGSLTLGW